MLQHLLARSETSLRLALPEFTVLCSLSGKRVLKDEAVTEISSYLLFDAEFCNQLMELGRSDVAAERERIETFFAGRRDG